MKKAILLVLIVALVSILMGSCSNSKDGEPTPQPTFKDVTLKAQQTYTINGGAAMTWQSEEPLVASVKDGVVTAERVGTTRVYSGAKSFQVTVEPNYNTYREPCLQWGASMSKVKDFMSGYTIKSENDKSIYYEGRNKEALMGYTFENSALKAAGVFLQPYYAEELGKYLNERYIFLGYSNEIIVFESIDKKTVIGIEAEMVNGSPVCLVVYASKTSSSAPMQRLKQIGKKPVAAEGEMLLNSIAEKLIK